MRLSAGDALLSDAVFVRDQSTSCVDVWLPPEPPTGCVASSPAFELRKNSVPLLSVSNVLPGVSAGQTVNPGCVVPASLGALTMPDVSKCIIVTLAAPAASCCFERA